MDEKDVLLRLSETETAVVGALSGVVEAAATQPLTYVKNSLQQRIALQGNPFIWFRGTPASCAADGTLIGCQFLLCGALQKLCTEVTFGEELRSAFIAGAVSGVPCCVFELAMIQQQRFGGSFWETVGRLKHNPFRGLAPSAGREAFFAAGYLGVSPQIERSCDGILPTHARTAVASIVSGLTCALFTHPLDTIKSCMQGDLYESTYKGVLHTASTIAQQGRSSLGSSGSPHHHHHSSLLGSSSSSSSSSSGSPRQKIIPSSEVADMTLRRYPTVWLLRSGAPFFRGYPARAAVIVVCFQIFTESKRFFADVLFPETTTTRPR